jgi:hypothetical protein
MPRGTPATASEEQEDKEYLLSQLTARRTQANRSPVLRFPVAEGYLANAKRRIARGASPQIALESALQVAADEGDRDLSYWFLPVDTLSSFDFPRDIVEASDLHIAIEVVHRRDPTDSSRDRYIVMFVMSRDGIRQTGSTGPNPE